MHILKEKRRKLDNKAKNCIILCNKDGLKGYELWNIVTRTTVYNQDVVFRDVKSASRNEDNPKKKDQRK